MRPTFVHVLTGLLLGTALAGLLNVPGQIVAHQESIPPVRSPHAAKPKKDLVVRVSPELERSLTKPAKPAKPARPRIVTRVVVKPVLVRTPVNRPQAPAEPAAPSPKPAAKPKPRPAAPAPAPKVVLAQPQPAPAPSDDDEDDDDDGGDDDDDGGDDEDDGGDRGGGGGEDDEDD